MGSTPFLLKFYFQFQSFSVESNSASLENGQDFIVAAFLGNSKHILVGVVRTGLNVV